MDNKDNYKGRNEKVFQDLEVVLEKIAFGVVAVDFNLHNKRITSIKIHGQEHKKYK